MVTDCFRSKSECFDDCSYISSRLVIAMFSIIRSRLASIACYGLLLPVVLCVLLSIFVISASYIAGYRMITVMLFGLQQVQN